MPAKWDTAAGKKMWEEGCTDGEIAKRFGISANTVLYQRQKHWEKRKTSAPPENKLEETVPASETKEEQKEEVKLEVNTEVKKTGGQTAIYDFLEEATSNMRGIRAICTAEAILQLWQWDSKEDLLKAKAAIEYLLKKEDR